jgi:hypothetical protein
MAKNVPVTSVTPKIKVKASTPKEQASTRKTIATIAALVPAGRAAKTATTAVKAAARIQKLSAAEKAMVKDVKYVAKNAKPGSVQKAMDTMTPKQKRAYSEALTKAAGNKTGIYKKTPLEPAKRVETKIMNSRGKIITVK